MQSSMEAPVRRRDLDRVHPCAGSRPERERIRDTRMGVIPGSPGMGKIYNSCCDAMGVVLGVARMIELGFALVNVGCIVWRAYNSKMGVAGSLVCDSHTSTDLMCLLAYDRDSRVSTV